MSDIQAELVQRRANPDFDFDLTYYLSGPMAGYPEHNWPAFEKATQVLRDTGVKLISPDEVNPAANLSAPPTYPVHFLKADIIEMITKADGIILLKGWPRSRGAKAELSIALDLEYPVWYYHDFQLINMNGDVS